MKTIFLFLSLCLCFCTNAQIATDPTHTFLIETKTGKPFFWLGDTGWEIFHRIKREDVLSYLNARQAQGFNVIQAVALAEMNGIKEPNRYGDLPFINGDPEKWAVTPGNDAHSAKQYDYWDNVDFVIKEAAKRKIYIALLPTWGDKVVPGWGDGPQIFNEQNAYAYAKKLAGRYKNQWNIIWMLGGDRPAVYERNGQHYDVKNIWRSMANGIGEVCGKNVFITYHPGGQPYGSSLYIHNEPWLKMNGIQSGHGDRRTPVWDYIKWDMEKLPKKPVMDLEPCYEDHPVNPWDGKWTRDRGYFTDYDVRARVYRGVFAGGCGTTYGHYAVWQFADSSIYPLLFKDTVFLWKQVLDTKAAAQMKYIKRLMYSHKDFNRIADDLLVTSYAGKDYTDKIIATKNKKGTYALVYLPQSMPVTINMSRLQKGIKKAKWFNPVTGNYTTAIVDKLTTTPTFIPPRAQQKDWVLVLDVM